MNYSNMLESFLDKKLFITNTNLFFSNNIDTNVIENLRTEKVTIMGFSRKNLVGLNFNPEVILKSNNVDIIKIKY